MTIGLRILAGAALPLLALMGPRLDAAAGSHRAALVIEHSNGSLLERCVSFATEAITGLQLIQMARPPIENQTKDYGGMGAAVCQLDNEPAQVPDNCFGSASWAYFRETPGGWSLSATGASGSVVHDGDVDGWRYAAGPEPPPTVAFSRVCTPSAAAPALTRAAAAPVATLGSPAAQLPATAKAPSGEASDPAVDHSPMRTLTILPDPMRSAPARFTSLIDLRSAAVFAGAAAALALSLLLASRRRAP